MQAQFTFLGHPTYADPRTFGAQFGRAATGQAARACRVMQLELLKCMVRRNKTDMLCGRKILELTPKAISLVEVEFGRQERQLYKVLEAKAINRVNELRRVSDARTDCTWWTNVLH